MFFFLSRYMQEVLGYSALKAGLSYLPLALAIIVSAGGASVLVTKLGFKPVLLAGLVLVTIGLLWFAQVPERRRLPDGPPRADGHLRGRAGLRVRAGHDRRRQRGLGGRVGAGVRASSTRPSRSAARSASRSWGRSPASKTTDLLLAERRARRRRSPAR